MRDRLRLWLSNGRALRAEQIFNRAPYLDGLKEAGIVFEHAFDSFFDELGPRLAGCASQIIEGRPLCLAKGGLIVAQ